MGQAKYKGNRNEKNPKSKMTRKNCPVILEKAASLVVSLPLCLLQAVSLCDLRHLHSPRALAEEENGKAPLSVLYLEKP